METTSTSPPDPVPEADAEFVAIVRRVERLHGMFIADQLFPSLCSYLRGYERGRAGDVLDRFRAWLIPRTGGHGNRGIEDLVLLHAIGRAQFPLLDLTRAEHDAANAAFFALFEEFVAAGAPAPPPAAVDPP